MYTTDNRRRIRLAIVSPTPPRACPVAAYTDDLCRILPLVAPRIGLTVYAIDHGDGRPTVAGRPAAGSIAADDPSAYRRAGQRLQRLGVDVALLEVGPGTAGGPHGRYLLGLTDELTRLGVPYLVAPHQVRPSPLPDDANVLAALCRNAAGVVVSSNCARHALAASRIVPPRRVAVVPTRPAPELMTAPRNGERPVGPVLLTMGYLSPARGVETVVAALPALAAAHPDVRYVVAGRTLASPTRTGSDRYRRAVADAAAALDVADRLVLLNTDPTHAEAAALLHAADVYVAPHLDPGRTDDGPLAAAVAIGLRVVASATAYAVELRGDRPGAVVTPGDPGALAEGRRAGPRRHGVRQRVPRPRARAGAHARRDLPHRARAHQRGAAPPRDPLQRNGSGEAQQLAEVREVHRAGAVPADRAVARPAGRDAREGRTRGCRCSTTCRRSCAARTTGRDRTPGGGWHQSGIPPPGRSVRL